MKTIKINYRGAFISERARRNITRALKRAYKANEIKKEGITILDLYVYNVALPHYTAKVILWKTNDDYNKYGLQDDTIKLEITVLELYRNEATSSIGSKVKKQILIENNKCY